MELEELAGTAKMVKSDLHTTILVVAATQFEMSPFTTAYKGAHVDTLICGVGPVESCLRLTRYLEKNGDAIRAVVSFGVGGGYIGDNGEKADMLDICIATMETFGDFGICFPRRIDDFDGGFGQERFFVQDDHLIDIASRVLKRKGVAFKTGNFVTVSCVSGTRVRGEILRDTFNGICENMEGAALARACKEFSLPFFEIRCISNHVEDRNRAGWKIQEACNKCGAAAAEIVAEFGEKI